MTKPTHVVAFAGARRALCGEKDPLPKVHERYVQAHVAGHGMEVCPACAVAMKVIAEADR